ncbi:MAG TPA: OB-fold domain-containing protein [Mycobacteriales bacterium]|nr:OB-fold domain-containing protein [Mycobacteriales bacterium]
MRGIVGWGVHLPLRRLDRAQIPALVGLGGGKGTRSVAGFDEDTTTMAVEAGRQLLASTSARPSALWFATAAPAYVDKTNATAVHAALRLDRETAAYDANGSMRSAMGALTAALDATGPAIVAASDIRVGLPGGPEETTGGDAAAAVLIADEQEAPVVAEVVARVALTEEFLDRWRVPGEVTSRTWEERFGETKYVPLAQEALKSALGAASLDVADVDRLAVAGLHERAAATVAKKSGVADDNVVDRLALSVGNPGVAQPLLLLAAALEESGPGDVVVLLTLADGADALVLRTTEALAAYRPVRPVAAQVAGGAPLAYGRYLAWRGLLPVEPPRRPEPARPSASAAGRTAEWKYGLATTEGVLADQRGTVTTFTVDKLAYSPSPPVVFAVVDFDDGQRLPVELTDVDADDVQIGMRVEMTFRRPFTADGIANYFWKARPVRGES